VRITSATIHPGVAETRKRDECNAPSSCSTTPSFPWFAAGAVLLAAGLILVMAWRRRPAG
jgi:hypothetical protein